MPSIRAAIDRALERTGLADHARRRTRRREEPPGDGDGRVRVASRLSMPGGTLLRERRTLSLSALRRDYRKQSCAGGEPRGFPSTDRRQGARTGPDRSKSSASVSGYSATIGSAAGAETPLSFPVHFRGTGARRSKPSDRPYNGRPSLGRRIHARASDPPCQSRWSASSRNHRHLPRRLLAKQSGAKQKSRGADSAGHPAVEVGWPVQGCRRARC